MRVTQAKAAESRDRIVAAAARLFRERGIDGVGIDAIMEAAGLTHGGFYRHFRSKDDLAAEAVGLVLPRGTAPADDLAGYAARYLSVAHRDDPGRGCVMAALGCDAARGGAGVRRRFAQLVSAQVARFVPWFGGPDRPDARTRAIAGLSAMVGALVLARAVDDPALSEEILAAVRGQFGVLPVPETAQAGASSPAASPRTAGSASAQSAAMAQKACGPNPA